MDDAFGLGNLLTLSDERSRAITAENPDGAPGAGGQAASRLGPGRKGRPNVPIESGETVTVAEIDGPGVIKHVWMTTPNELHGRAHLVRDLVLRIFWDDEDDPSVEVPLGDFFCCGHGRYCQLRSLPVTVGANGGLNCYLPMPFRERAEITVENTGPVDVDGPRFFYQVDDAASTRSSRGRRPSTPSGAGRTRWSTGRTTSSWTGSRATATTSARISAGPRWPSIGGARAR
jgi:hypothetical protein